MANVKVTAELLEMAGWTETQIDRYYKLQKRRSVHGLHALTVADRRFYLSASVAANKASAELDKVIKSAQKRRVNGAQPVETKLHYRWVAFNVANLNKFAELAVGEVLDQEIVYQEQLRALEIYQPVLDQIDTSKRSKFNAPVQEMYELAACFGRQVSFDQTGWDKALTDNFQREWNPAWAKTGRTVATALSGDEIAEFRSYIRPEIERLTREIYPSVANTVAV